MVNSILNIAVSAPKVSSAQSVGRETRGGGSNFGEIFNDASQRKSTVEDEAPKSEANTDEAGVAEASPARDSGDRHSNATAEKQNQDEDVAASQSTTADNQVREEVDAVKEPASGAEAEELDSNIDDIVTVDPTSGGTNLQPNESESAAENSEFADISATAVDEQSESAAVTAPLDTPETVLADGDSSVAATEAQAVSDEQLQSTLQPVSNQSINAQPVANAEDVVVIAHSDEAEVLSGSQVLQSQALKESGKASPMQTSIEERRQQDNLAWVLGQLNPKSDLSSQASGTLSPIASGISSSLTPSAGKMSLSTEALMSLVAEQTGTDVTESGDQLLYQSGAGSSSATTSLGGAAAAPATTTGGATLSMSVPPQSGAWPLEMAQKVSWVASEGVKTAHIQLDPPELGSLTIKVTMDQDGNTHVSFVAANAQSRDVIEGQMQRLRDMLQQQGIELDSVDVNVAQDNTAGQQGESYGEDENAARTAGIGNDLEATEDVNVSYIDPADRGIDFYA